MNTLSHADLKQFLIQRLEHHQSINKASEDAAKLVLERKTTVKDVVQCLHEIADETNHVLLACSDVDD